MVIMTLVTIAAVVAGETELAGLDLRSLGQFGTV